MSFANQHNLNISNNNTAFGASPLMPNGGGTSIGTTTTANLLQPQDGQHQQFVGGGGSSAGGGSGGLFPLMETTTPTLNTSLSARMTASMRNNVNNTTNNANNSNNSSQQRNMTPSAAASMTMMTVGSAVTATPKMTLRRKGASTNGGVGGGSQVLNGSNGGRMVTESISGIPRRINDHRADYHDADNNNGDVSAESQRLAGGGEYSSHNSGRNSEPYCDRENEEAEPFAGSLHLMRTTTAPPADGGGSVVIMNRNTSASSLHGRSLSAGGGSMAVATGRSVSPDAMGASKRSGGGVAVGFSVANLLRGKRKIIPVALVFIIVGVIILTVLLVRHYHAAQKPYFENRDSGLVFPFPQGVTDKMRVLRRGNAEDPAVIAAKADAFWVSGWQPVPIHGDGDAEDVVPAEGSPSTEGPTPIHVTRLPRGHKLFSLLSTDVDDADARAVKAGRGMMEQDAHAQRVSNGNNPLDTIAPRSRRVGASTISSRYYTFRKAGDVGVSHPSEFPPMCNKSVTAAERAQELLDQKVRERDQKEAHAAMDRLERAAKLREEKGEATNADNQQREQQLQQGGNEVVKSNRNGTADLTPPHSHSYAHESRWFSAQQQPPPKSTQESWMGLCNSQTEKDWCFISIGCWGSGEIASQMRVAKAMNIIVDVKAGSSSPVTSALRNDLLPTVMEARLDALAASGATPPATLLRPCDIRFGLINGDNFYPKGIMSRNTERVFVGFEKIYDMPALMSMPWFASLGNHDYQGNWFEQIPFMRRPVQHTLQNFGPSTEAMVSTSDNWMETLSLDTELTSTKLLSTSTLKPSATQITSFSTGRWYMPYTYYSARVSQEMVLITLDSSLMERCANNGDASPRCWDGGKQGGWLRDLLETLDTDPLLKYRIIQCHFPINANGPHTNNGWLKQLVEPLMIKYGVQLYINADNHYIQVSKKSASSGFGGGAAGADYYFVNSGGGGGYGKNHDSSSPHYSRSPYSVFEKVRNGPFFHCLRDVGTSQERLVTVVYNDDGEKLFEFSVRPFVSPRALK